MSNILSEVHPELVAEWSDKNLPLTPDRITYGSNKVVWWKGACGHEWQTSVKARSNGENCPICSGARVIEGINDLATLKPELADEWSSKNDPLKPTMVTTGSHKKVIWQDKYGHEWTATVKSRALNGTGCPYCSHNKVLVGFNDLASQRPQIASEWSERNYPLKPDMVTVFANRKVWWRCSKGHEWNTLISTRSGGSGCPYCSGQLLLKGFNDFATTHPQLAQEWSDRNLPFTPDMINEKSRRNVWWKCRECGYEWQSVVYARVKGTVCPVCADRAVMEGYNDLATTDAHLLPEWDYEKNKDISPNKISRHSMQSVWWKCSLGHSWKAKISEKAIEGKGCKVCEKDYLTVFPKLAVMYYAAKKRIKVQTDTDKIIGIPLEIYFPEEKAAIETVSQTEKVETLNRHIYENETIMKDFRNARHNLKQHFIVLIEMLEDKENKEASDYLRKLIDTEVLRNVGISKTGNIVVDSLINAKYCIATKLDIKFEVVVHIPMQLPFHGADISVLLGNILDNAIEAAIKIPEENRYIKCFMRYENSVLIITVINAFSGKVLKGKNGKLITNKSDSGNHGIGLESVNKIANKYHGSAIIEIKEETFVIKVVLYDLGQKLHGTS